MQLLVTLAAHHTSTLMSSTASWLLVYTYLPTITCYSEYLHDSLGYLICRRNYQWADFITTHCFTKPVTEWHFGNKHFCEQHCLMLLLKEHIMFPLTSSLAKNVWNLFTAGCKMDFDRTRTPENWFLNFLWQINKISCLYRFS